MKPRPIPGTNLDFSNSTRIFEMKRKRSIQNLKSKKGRRRLSVNGVPPLNRRPINPPRYTISALEMPKLKQIPSFEYLVDSDIKRSKSLKRGRSIRSNKSGRRMVEYRVPTKTAFHKSGRYSYPQTKAEFKRRSSIRDRAKYRSTKQLNSVFSMVKDGTCLNALPYYLIQYSLNGLLDSVRINPTLRYEIERTSISQGQMQLLKSGLTMDQYLTLPISNIMNVVEENDELLHHSLPISQRRVSSNTASASFSTTPRKVSGISDSTGNSTLSSEYWTDKQLNKYGLEANTVKDLTQTTFEMSSNPSGSYVSNAAEMSLETSSELYKDYLTDIFSKHFASWSLLESSMKDNYPEMYNSAYFKLRLMIEIYIRRVVAARLAVSLGTEKSRRYMNRPKSEIWEKISRTVEAVYGKEQLIIFKEQK